MKPSEITTEWLQKQTGWLIQKPNAVTVKDVYLKDLKVILDGRGEVTELWSKNWPIGNRLWCCEVLASPCKTYRSVHRHARETAGFFG